MTESGIGECQHLHCMGIEKGQYSSTSDLQTCLCTCGNYQCVPIHGLPLIRIPVLLSLSVEVGRGYCPFHIFYTFKDTGGNTPPLLVHVMNCMCDVQLLARIIG